MATARKKPSKKTNTKKTNTKKKTTTNKPAAGAIKTAKTVSKYELLRRFHLFSVIISSAIAVLAVILLNNQSINLTTTYSALDPIANDGAAILGTAYETLFSVEFRYVVAALFAVAAVLSLLLATSLRSRYEAGIKNATSFYRWLFGGIVFALLLESITALAGVQDIATLKLIAGLVITASLLGYLAERNNKKANSPHWVAYGLSLFTGFLAWLPALIAILGTHLYGAERYGWHVYVLTVIALAVCIKFAYNQYQFIKYPSKHKDYILLEEKYLSNELFVKLAFASVIFIALIK